MSRMDDSFHIPFSVAKLQSAHMSPVMSWHVWMIHVIQSGPENPKYSYLRRLKLLSVQISPHSINLLGSGSPNQLFHALQWGKWHTGTPVIRILSPLIWPHCESTFASARGWPDVWGNFGPIWTVYMNESSHAYKWVMNEVCETHV